MRFSVINLKHTKASFFFRYSNWLQITYGVLHIISSENTVIKKESGNGDLGAVDSISSSAMLLLVCLQANY